MNHIYKVVWSKVRNSYMAVSEIAKGHGKKSTSGKWGGKKAALLAAIILTFGGFANAAMAADPAIVNDGKNILSTDAKFKDEIAESPLLFPEGGGQSIAIGKGAYAFMQGGLKASLMRFGEKKVTGAIAIGEGAQALSQSIAIGNRV